MLVRLCLDRVGYLGLVKLVANDGRTESRRDEAVHLAGSRMALEGRLREQQLAVEHDLESAAAAGQERRPGDPRRPRVKELSHQTGGSIRVVSDDAELDLKFVRSVGRLGLHARTLRRDACLRPAPRTIRASWAAVVPIGPALCPLQPACVEIERPRRESYSSRPAGQLPMTSRRIANSPMW
jgi:hypothetical protein